MWSSRYRREQSSEGFQLSPCLTASSGLLTPPSSYSIDARRNSTASTLSSLGPTTPVYGRNPFSDHGYVSVASIDESQDESMEYTFKAPPVSEGTTYDNWSALGQTGGLDATVPIGMHDGFVPHSTLVQNHMGTYAGVDNTASSLPGSAPNSFSSVPYTDFHGHMSDGTDHIINGEPIQPMWTYQYAMAHMMVAPTMAPNEALLGGEYVQVNQPDADTDMGAYDDVDVPLVPSPQEVIVKHEDTEASEDERRVKRSIWVSSTGGKSVKKEQQAGALKKKTKRTRSKALTRLHGDRYEIWMDDDVEQIPGTKQWRRHGGGSYGKPQICQIEVDNSPCGRKFQRQEHLHRHMKTHSGRKDFVCQLCYRHFNRNDNCWEHYWTHVLRPGKKTGRNDKFSLRRVLKFITDPKHSEKLYNKWRKELGYEYTAENDPKAQEEEDDEEDEDDMPSPVRSEEEDGQTSSSVMEQDDCRILCKL